ncbi:pilus assembly protein CpaB [Pseudovibrio ascidiaceicola]|uniref:Pilus assembly protein CpaB n=1 Tax=Pseudovibrio ascidiaceicola TaxID=285279 RepID=A0A1I3YU85_9HYPH|nr:Flp pilus assembly protein CpaB [Pseudovibrio ascidiaceicola]SFK35330.1 pilus assembly protein CpaB [Pseudovibrio ascidiaceicola]
MKASRLLVLIIALSAGGLAAWLNLSSGSREQSPTIVVQEQEIPSLEILVAAQDLKVGTSLTEGDLAWAKWPEESVSDGVILRRSSPNADNEFLGQIIKAAMFGGEPIRAERLIDTEKGFLAAILPKGKRAVAVPVDAVSTAGGFILPGDKVDVLVTMQAKKRDDGVISETLLENIKVLAIDTTTASENSEKAMSPDQTATLELFPHEAETIARATQMGTLSLSLRSAADSKDGVKQPPRVKGGVKFVKYGIASQSVNGN